MHSDPVPRPSPAKRSSSILEQHSPDLEPTSVHLQEQPLSRSIEPFHLGGKEQPIRITIDELTESCLIDERVIEHIQTGSPWTGSFEEFRHRSLSIASDALQRITMLLIHLKQSMDEADHDGPGTVSVRDRFWLP
jgi:hypothetical protein